ncbi:transposase [Pseudoalteromonas sp. KG3]|jgi:putative transposase|uniref:Transposase n=1 Tax=Pseudoalteromonas prydzensis TaxID=182141 RepID=A0ABR9FT50_9GAMM|nr:MULTISPECIES: transposase [Pseudoalteromonas]MBE0459991.1 transposase [Pseudoalteromonas prydzensis]WKD25068.1 transposase [Pseudoalteromonas sp. KG3]WKD25069.1 transposase [Pseudoalteromonas sp. KG3]
MYKSQNLRKGRVSLSNHFYAITLVTHNRSNYFVSLDFNRQIIKQMQLLEVQKHLKSNAFSIMPNHIHWQFQLLNNTLLPQIIRCFKGRTAVVCREFGIYKLWQKGYYDHLIRDEDDLINNARYIIANPLRAGLVKNVADYPYWDCVYV